VLKGKKRGCASASATTAVAQRVVGGCQGAGGDRGAADLGLGHWESGRES